MNSKKASHSRWAQILHWLSTLLIFILWPLGIAMTRMEPGARQIQLFQVHIAIGLLILLLTLLRIGLRWLNNSPKVPPGLSAVQQRTLKIAHALQYIILLLLSFSGIGMLALIGFNLYTGSMPHEALNGLPPQTLHRVLSRIFMVLLVMHIGGVIRHQLTKGDVMARMGVHLSR